ncbi:MAG: magnesium transporter CorA family protein [Pirellulales bacterium]|nr:magnesium transporter CorA family protein [Pirellulales bacterium]
MITAYLRHADGTARVLSRPDELAAEWSDQQAVVWIDVEQPTEEEVRAVDAVIDLDDEAWDDCLRGRQRPRIDEYENYIFLLVYGLSEPEAATDPVARKLAAFCGNRFLITVHQEPFAAIEHLRGRCRLHASTLLQRGVDHLLYYVIDAIVDGYLRVSETYETVLEQLEERSQDLDSVDSVLGELSDLRRRLLELRRIAASQLQLLEPVSEGEYDYVSGELGRGFSHVRDHLLKVIEHVDSLREVANGVRDNYHAAIAMRTNAIMRTLTVFASVLLPLSLISGIYGMNLPVWPKPEHPASFWGVIGVMAAVAGGLLWYFRRKRWV